MAKLREIEQVVQGMATSDGAGVDLVRYIAGSALQQRLDPFLMLDVFGSDDPNQYIAGFPNHPHRGFETITYMFEGNMLHRDSAGNEGLLTNGDIQWMCAGYGVVHSEMPQQIEGRMEGFQLWLNLPAKDKLCEPWYRDLRQHEIPLYEYKGSRIAVVSGESHGVKGLIERPVTEPIYLNVEQVENSTLHHPLPTGHNAFIQMHKGRIVINEQIVEAPCLVILNNPEGSGGVEISTDTDSHYLLIAGKPLNEPIAQYGPFVMNTEAELHQAVEDYRNGLMN